MAGRATRLQEKESAKTHARPGAWKCNQCRQQFTVTVGTILENSHIPLNKWLAALYLCSATDSLDGRKLQSELAITYKSLVFMIQRIRYARIPEQLSPEGTIPRTRIHISLPFDEAIQALLKAGPIKKQDPLEALDRAAKRLVRR